MFNCMFMCVCVFSFAKDLTAKDLFIFRLVAKDTQYYRLQLNKFCPMRHNSTEQILFVYNKAHAKVQ